MNVIARAAFVLPVLVFLALVVTVVLFFAGKGSRPLEFTVYSGIATGTLFVAGAGAWFAGRSHDHHPRSSLFWQRMGFLACLAVVGVFTASPWLVYPVLGVPSGPAMLHAGVLLAGLGIVTGVFTYASYRTWRRHSGKRHHGMER